MNSPVLNEIGTVFIPVSNIERARDWYCDLLGVPADDEVQFGHIYVLPMKGSGIVLDSKIYSPDLIAKHRCSISILITLKKPMPICYTRT